MSKNWDNTVAVSVGRYSVWEDTKADTLQELSLVFTKC